MSHSETAHGPITGITLNCSTLTGRSRRPSFSTDLLCNNTTNDPALWWLLRDCPQTETQQRLISQLPSETCFPFPWIIIPVFFLSLQTLTHRGFSTSEIIAEGVKRASYSHFLLSCFKYIFCHISITMHHFLLTWAPLHTHTHKPPSKHLEHVNYKGKTPPCPKWGCNPSHCEVSQ